MLQGLWRVKKEIMIQSTKAWRKEEFSFCPDEEQLFPQRLTAIPDAPYSLYVKGTIPQEWNNKTVAIVGARRCSAYGRSVAEKIAGRLAASDAWVVSGMASGVDGSGHTGALR